MGKTEIEEGQLALPEEKKEKEKKGSKKWVVILLILTVAVSLVFYFLSGIESLHFQQAPKVYEF